MVSSRIEPAGDYVVLLEGDRTPAPYTGLRRLPLEAARYALHLASPRPGRIVNVVTGERRLTAIRQTATRQP